MQHADDSKMPHRYAVYGITLVSDTALPGLEGATVPSTTLPDIRISMGGIPQEKQIRLAREGVQYYCDPGDEESSLDRLLVNSEPDGRYYHFRYGEGVEFMVDTCYASVWCQWHSSLTLADATLYLLGPIVGFMLRWRGTTCLHASGVLVQGNALAITGTSGAGKSTLAAAFAVAGYPILTDDVLPLTTINGQINTQSGYSRLRLLPNTVKNLPELPDDLPPVAPGWDKFSLDLTSGKYRFHSACAPLQVIYVLDWSHSAARSPVITPVGASEAVSLLAANTYRNELLSTRMRRQEFHFLSTLAATVSVRKLCPIDDIAAVPLLRDLLVADFEGLTLRAPFESAEQAENGALR